MKEAELWRFDMLDFVINALVIIVLIAVIASYMAKWLVNFMKETFSSSKSKANAELEIMRKELEWIELRLDRYEAVDVTRIWRECYDRLAATNK